MTKTYIPVKGNPAKVFAIDSYKPQGRPAVVFAQEGTYTRGGDGDFSSFECELFGVDRSHRVAMEGNNTAKNRAKAFAVLLSDLEDKGWVEKGHSVSTD